MRPDDPGALGSWSHPALLPFPEIWFPGEPAPRLGRGRVGRSARRGKPLWNVRGAADNRPGVL